MKNTELAIRTYIMAEALQNLADALDYPISTVMRELLNNTMLLSETDVNHINQLDKELTE